MRTATGVPPGRNHGAGHRCVDYLARFLDEHDPVPRLAIHPAQRHSKFFSTQLAGSLAALGGPM